MSLDYCKRLYWSDDLRYHLVAISPHIHGFVYRSRKGILHILVDESLSPSAQKSTILHEAHHVENDLRNGKSIVEINHHNDRRETEAETCAASEK